jgi:hypothetical protein
VVAGHRHFSNGKAVVLEVPPTCLMATHYRFSPR